MQEIQGGHGERGGSHHTQRSEACEQRAREGQGSRSKPYVAMEFVELDTEQGDAGKRRRPRLPELHPLPANAYTQPC